MRQSLRSFFVVLLLTLSAHAAFAQKVIGEAAKELAEQIAASAAKQQKHKIAVIPFRELDGRTTVLGTFLAEELVTDLFATGNLDIVERSMLDKVMSELKLSQSGAIDPESAKHVGKIVGVEALVTGSITDLQSYVGVNCRLIDTETGRIFGAAQTKIVKDADLQKIMSATVPDAAAAAPTPAPAPKHDAQLPPQKNINGIGVQLLGCRAAGGNVSCNLMLTNETQEDRQFRLMLKFYEFSATLIDDQSNEYRSTGGSLGRLSSDNDGYLETTLVPGIPLKAAVRFRDVPDTVSGIRLLRVKFYANENLNADFRDLPLTR
jgi:TolB-like protein